MFTDLFKSGNLELSATPLRQVAEECGWSDVITNKILVFVAAALILVNIRLLSDLAAALAYSFSRVRGAVDLEHSINKARMRNISALLFALPFCLVADRFALICPDFLGIVPPAWHAPAMIGVFAAYMMVRNLCFALFRPKRADSEMASAIHHSPYSYFILLSALVILTAFAMSAMHLDDALIRTVILWEIAVLFFFSLIRTAQLLGSICNGFSTILYLCALEVLPSAILVACAVKL